MLLLLNILSGLLGLGMLVCWIMEIIAAFKKEEKPLMGILSIVLGFVTCGLGPVVIGWIYAKKWDIKKIMMIWTVLLIAYIIVFGIAFTKGAASAASGMEGLEGFEIPVEP